MENNISIYIHYPFCRSKCPYCDFNSYCSNIINDEKLLNGYSNEIEYYRNILSNRTVETIYFGGGTPSLMDPKTIDKILAKISTIAKISSSCEISMEANPNSLDLLKIKELKSIGINRISIGIQSLRDDDLRFLGRIHSRGQGIDAIEMAQKIFGDGYSIDLIYARPNQNIDDWIIELNEAIKLSPFHISLYQLIIEKGTPFYRHHIKVQNDDLTTEMYSLTADILKNNGIEFYEISNYSKPGYECRHNMVYWNNGEWLGIGAGAHSRINIGKKRYAIQNLKKPEKWLKKCLEQDNGVSLKRRLSNNEIIEEFVLMGLRIKDGIALSNIQKNIDCNSLFDILNEKNIDFLEKEGFIEANSDNIRIIGDNFLLLNSIIEKVLV